MGTGAAVQRVRSEVLAVLLHRMPGRLVMREPLICIWSSNRCRQIAYLECSRCHAHISAETPQTVCPQCATQPAGSLFVRYDFSHLKGSKACDVIAKDAAGPWAGMWRYRSVLPDAKPVTLGEGWTPMLRSKRYSGAFEGRGRQSYGHLQGARAGDGGDDGEALRTAQARRAFGGKCGGSAGGLCGSGGDGGAYLHAARCSVCELC